ncbi:hypothetical protein, partial [Dermatophilus congolensis]|uniref:hypothetical protein n=1 Tax=Dermatophilus congolensis TaxID=1863 RepID=UPI001AAE8FE4
MAGSAHPHIIFTTTDTTLTKDKLETILGDLFTGHEPPPVTTTSVLNVTLSLGSYTFTFWYDDEAEGLGDRYAEYAPTLEQRRISRCTTMIDFSGDHDPANEHNEAARTIIEHLASLPDTYVFSEEKKTFIAMDYTDPFATPTEETPTPAPTTQKSQPPQTNDKKKKT